MRRSFFARRRTLAALPPWILALALALGAGCASLGPPVPSLPEVKQQLTSYVDSGEYLADVERRVERARRQLMRSMADVERPAVVLDIDETSLFNWGYEVETDFCYTEETWDEWVVRADAPPLEPTLDLYRFARRAGVAVFFITGRREPQRAATEANLRSAGYEEWAGLFLRPVDDHGSPTPYKTDRRRQIESDGYTIVLNMGDQHSDLEGGHALATVKLPNPFYEIP